jgi:hypothetical protein
MTEKMNIDPAVAYQETAALNEFLKKRAFVLAQTLAEVAAERDQVIADRDAIRGELQALKTELAKGEPNGAAE